MKRVLAFVADMDLTYYILVVLVGVGCLGYIGYHWTRHWMETGRYGLLGFALGLAALVSIAAALRIPVGMLVLTVAAASTGFAFVLGHGSVLLP